MDNVERDRQRARQALTSREFLYHLPCEPSARKLDGFGSGWLAPETAMRTDRVVVDPPALRHDLRFLERIKQFPVEKLRPHFSIERFDIAVLPGGSRLDIEGCHVERL